MTQIRISVFVFLVLMLAPSLSWAQADDQGATSTNNPRSEPTTSSAPDSRESTNTPTPALKEIAPDLKTDGGGLFTQQQIRELIRKVADKDMANDKKQRDYTYIEREEEHKLDARGQVKSTEVRTREVLMLYGQQVERLIAKNDKPLSDQEARKEEEKIQKVIDKRKNESADERQKRLAKEEKEHEDSRKFVLEVADAYNFRLTGMDEVEGRETYVIDATPRPEYQPRLKEAKVLPKLRFRIWIDKAETQWVKLDAELIDTVSFGWVLARLHKGSRILIDTTRVNDEVWLPKHVAVRADARVALLKNYRLDEDVTYRDYKKFRTDSKIVGVGEVKEPEHTEPRNDN